IEFGRMKLAEFNRELDKLQEHAPVLDLSAFSPIFRTVAGEIDNITKSLNELQQKALDDTPWKKLEDGLNALGIKGAAYYEHQVDVAQKAYDDILNSGLATDDELEIAAAKLAEAQARYALSVGEITRAVYDDIMKTVENTLSKVDASHKASTEH